VNDLSPEEKAQAMEALMFLQEKKDGTMKGRMVYNGKPTHEWLSREDSASPTAALESTFLTSKIDAKEERDVMSADVPNAFIQTPMPDDNKSHHEDYRSAGAPHGGTSTGGLWAMCRV